MRIRQRRAQAPEHDALADAGDALFQRAEHAPGKLFFEGVVIGGVLAGFLVRPLPEGVVADEDEGLAGMMPAVHLGRIFQGGDGQEHGGGRIGFQRLVGQPEAVQPIHVGVVVEPVVSGIQPGGAPKVHVHGEEQTQGGDGIFDVVQPAPQPAAEMLPPDEPAKRHLGIGVTDDVLRADLGPIGQLHAHRLLPFQEDACDRRPQAELSPGAFQGADQRARDGEAAAQRVIAAIEVVMRDPGVEEDRDLRGRQPVIAGLAGEDAFQQRVGDVGVNQVLPGAPRPPEHLARCANRPGRVAQAAHVSQLAQAIHEAVEGGEVSVNPLRLAGKARLQPLDQVLLAFGEVEALVADDDVVVPVRVDLAEGQVVRQPQPFVDAPQAASWPQVADVMHAGAEAVTCEREGMRPAAGNFVLLAHQHLLPGLRQGDGGGQPARAGADDDHVIVHKVSGLQSRLPRHIEPVNIFVVDAVGDAVVFAARARPFVTCPRVFEQPRYDIMQQSLDLLGFKRLRRLKQRLRHRIVARPFFGDG